MRSVYAGERLVSKVDDPWTYLKELELKTGRYMIEQGAKHSRRELDRTLLKARERLSSCNVRDQLYISCLSDNASGEGTYLILL